MRVKKMAFLDVGTGSPNEIYEALKGTEKIPDKAVITQVTSRIEGNLLDSADLRLGKTMVFEWNDDE